MTLRISKLIKLTLLLVSAFLLANNAFAQASASAPSTSQADSKAWHFEIAPYLWAAALKGDLRVRNTSTHVDASFSDLFKQLDLRPPLGSRRRKVDGDSCSTRTI
jgi:hypothetical protein